MQRTSTTRLPAALREKIQAEPDQNKRNRPKQVVSNRKEARKQARQLQKQRKAEFFSHSKQDDTQPSHKRPAVEQQQGQPVQKKPRLSKPLSTQHVDPGTLEAIPQKSREEAAEEARIAWLESKLGMRGKKKKAVFGDGLDELMDEIDKIVPMDNEPLMDSYASEEEDDPGPEVDLDDEEEEEADRDDGSTSGDSGAKNEEAAFSEFEGFSLSEEDFATKGALPAPSSPQDAELPPFTVTVNPIEKKCSAPAHSSAPSGTRYVPPHLRKAPTEESETLGKLSRQLKGLLNRLSEQNIASIMGSVEELYRNNRRHDVTSILTQLMVDGTSSHSSHLDAFVILQASLVAGLHKIIGVDFAANFIQSLIASYEKNYLVLREVDTHESKDFDHSPKGKECLNLVVLLSELYNFQVISCVLVYDIIRGLLKTLDEFDVELLLKISRNSGQQLRQDDPSALKDIIQIVQTKMSEKDKQSISSRTQFMIETLTNLKNNKVKRVVGQDGHSESVERMKKFLSGLSKKYHIMAHEPLRVSIEDLHSSEEKGKWWLVGSAWAGDPLVDRVQSKNVQSTTQDQSTHATNSLLKLARRQGMNTDVRRSIFIVLMSSDDYVDACERLSQLNLTEIQQREIVRVILHCLGNERQYNPYYTLVVQQLCQTSHSYKVTLQFCLWDFLRDLGEKAVGGAEIIKDLQRDDTYVEFDLQKINSTRRLNVARAYAWWIAKGCSSLTILKPVDFTVLQSQSRDFFRIMFFQLFLSSQVTSPAIAVNAKAAAYLTGPRQRQTLEEVFMKATRIPALTQGLIYFLATGLRGDDGTDNEVVSEILKWAREVAKDTLRTGIDVATSMT